MLNAQIARQAIAVKNEQIAYLRERIAQGSCCHGKFTAGYDMENACWTCEDEGWHSVEQQGYQAARMFIQRHRLEQLAETIQWLSKLYANDPTILARYVIWEVESYKAGK
jgi:hypothetical protein